MKKNPKKARLLFVLPVFAALIGCDANQALLEQAQFLLDGCNPTIEATIATNCTPAAVKAQAVLDSDPDNAKASILLSSAKMGEARVDFLSLISDFVNLTEGDDDNLAEFLGFLDTYEADLGDTLTTTELDALQEAVDAFDDLVTANPTGSTNEEIRQAFFQLGLTQSLNAFIQSIKRAGEDGVDITTNITGTVATNIIDSFENAAINMGFGGADDTESLDFLTPMRENFCRCDANGGMDENCLQDLLRCQLSSAATGGGADDAGIEKDYDEDTDTDDADCLALLTPADDAAFDACVAGN